MAPPTDNRVSLEGTLGHVVFRDDDSGFTIARLEREGEEPVTIKGLLAGVDTGERLRVSGRWQEDPRFGKQLRVDSFLPLVPETDAAIRDFLGRRVDGIGPVMAQRLVDHFGAQTLEVLDNQPHRIREVEGIGPTRADRVLAAWAKLRGLKEVMIFLQGLGVPPSTANRVWKAYGQRTVGVVRANPYQLAADIRGVGFLTADRVARAVGLAADSSHRLRAGLLHSLGQAGDAGHCYLPGDELELRSSELLRQPWPAIEEALRGLMVEGAVAAEEQHGRRRYWLTPVLDDEEEVAERLLDLSRGAIEAVDAGEADLSRAERALGITFSDTQRAALRAGAQGKVVVITGGPGTGKTTLVRALLDLWEGDGLSVRLAAPTGRAAGRMEEATGRPASTLHRLLEFSPREGRFLRDASNPLRCDALVVDEASMIDLQLCVALLRAVPPAGRLVLVGDVDQLPSVGPGQVLADVIASDAVPVVRLDVVFRQDDRGLIVRNAHDILQGRRPTSAPGPTGDFYFIRREAPEAAARTVVEVATRRIPQRWRIDPRADVQVLVPMRKGVCGAEALNERLRDALNPDTEGDGGARPRPGDRVMQIRNDYDKDVYNGDVGRVLRRGDGGKGLVVDFGGRSVAYDATTLGDLALAYAITIHKAQGSEYPAVVIPLLGPALPHVAAQPAVHRRDAGQGAGGGGGEPAGPGHGAGQRRGVGALHRVGRPVGGDVGADGQLVGLADALEAEAVAHDLDAVVLVDDRGDAALDPDGIGHAGQVELDVHQLVEWVGRGRLDEDPLG